MNTIHQEVQEIFKNLQQAEITTLQAISEGLRVIHPNPPKEPSPYPYLTPKEKVIHISKLMGITDKQLCTLLRVSPRSVITYKQKIKEKIAQHNQA